MKNFNLSIFPFSFTLFFIAIIPGVQLTWIVDDGWNNETEKTDENTICIFSRMGKRHKIRLFRCLLAKNIEFFNEKIFYVLPFIRPCRFCVGFILILEA